MKQVKDLEAKYMDKKIPDFDIGDTIDVSFKISEGDKTRIQIFTGIVIGRKGVGGQ